MENINLMLNLKKQVINTKIHTHLEKEKAH